MTLPCPRCGAPIDPPAPDAGPVTVCGTCGLAMATPYVRETLQLGTWHAWAGQRLTWLHERMLAEDMPSTAPAPGGTGAAPSGFPTTGVPAEGGQRRPASAGALLLAVGAFLLVAAGIAFLAFTWDLLGPFGQISVLLALGAGCLAATARLAARLRGTATALGVVGALLVLIAAVGTRTLGPDLIGETPSMLLATTIAAGLCAVAVWIRPRAAGVGELAGIVGSLTTIGVVATAPADDAVPIASPWSWWAAAACAVGGVLLVLLADRARLRAWPWVGAWFLVVASVTLAVAVQQWTQDITVSDFDAVVVAATLAAASVAVGVSLLPLTPHRVPVATATLSVWLLSLVVSWMSATSTPTARWAAALVLLATGLVGLVPSLLGARAPWLRGTVAVVGSAALGAAVGLLVAPWVDPMEDYFDAGSWADAAWPAWRGVVSGGAFVALLVASALLMPRLSARIVKRPGVAVATSTEGPAPLAHGSELVTDALPLVPVAVALLTWLSTSANDLVDATTGYGSTYTPEPTPDAYLHQVAVALGVLAVGVLAVALLRLLAAWTVWVGGALGVAAALVELGTRELDADVRPEVYGLALGVPTLAAAVGWWWLRRPQSTPTWQTIGPVLSLAVLPSTVALLDDTTNRWWYSEDPGTAYQVRMVVLLTIGVAAAVVGGWRRWSGLFFPGLALTVVVVAIQLIELGRFLPQWVSFAIAGALLIAAGARWEWVRDRGRVGAAWVRRLH